jgi:ribosomal protein S18 acetylase RimI-like enzyme
MHCSFAEATHWRGRGNGANAVILRSGNAIRLARPADAPAIAAVHVHAWRETYTGLVPAQVLSGLSVARRTELWSRIISAPEAFHSSVVFVAQREGAFAGFGCCGLQRAENLHARGYDGEISSLYLLRPFQRCGLGLALMRAMSQELQRRRLRAASLWVLRENQNACRFYESLGGDIVADKKDIGEDGVVFDEVAYGWRDLGALVRRATRC